MIIPHRLVVKSPETYESGLGNKERERERETIHKFCISEGRPGLDPRVGEGVNPVLFPLHQPHPQQSWRFYRVNWTLPTNAKVDNPWVCRDYCEQRRFLYLSLDSGTVIWTSIKQPGSHCGITSTVG